MLSSTTVSMQPACSRSFNLHAVSRSNTTKILQSRQHRLVPRLLRCDGARRSGGSSGSSSGAESSAWQERLYSEQQLADTINVAVTKRQRTSRAAGSNNHERPGGPDSVKPPPADKSYNSSAAGQTQGPSDFVVIKKAASSSGGSYIPTTTEMQVQEEELDGSRYWDAAIQEFDDEDDEDDEFDELDDEWEDEEMFGTDTERTSDDDDRDNEVGEVVSLLRELAAGLEEEEDEDSWEADRNADDSSSQSSDVGVAATQAHPDATVQWRRTYLGSAQPPLVVGPLCLKSSAGKGRGVFTTAAVPAGNVLLVAAPLALLYSEEGTTPENEELAEHLIAKAGAAASNQNNNTSISTKGLEPWQQHALLQLRVAGDDSELQMQQDVSVLRQLMGPPDENSHSAGRTGSSHGTAEQQQQQHALLAPDQLPNPEQLTQLVFANCTGEEFEDQALVLLRGSTSCGHLGIWPAAALINHSCAPNCHAMLLGERLVVRAARDIPASTELTLSYLGPQLYAPATVRQAELRQQWHFDCGCSRCKAEARYAGSTTSSSAKGSSKDTSTSTSLSAVLKEVHERCQHLAPELDAAVEAEDLYAVRGVQQELLQMQSSVEGSIRALKPPANVRKWLQACVYDLYDLISLAADQLPAAPSRQSKGGRRSSSRGGRKGGRSSDSSKSAPAVETEALASCVRIIGELMPGSSAHMELATEYMVRTEARFGSGHQEAADAASLCAAGITTRYAPINSSMLQLLMDTWAGAALL